MAQVVSKQLRDDLQKLIQLCLAKQKVLSTAESCTGGLLGSLLTSFPGVSEIYYGGVICYADQAKGAFLKVAPSLLKKHGAVSKQVALAMVAGALQQPRVNLAVSITGIAGPGGGTETKPVGLVYLAVASQEDGVTKTAVTENYFVGSRLQIQRASCAAAVQQLISILES